jgi:hypothetical protein
MKSISTPKMTLPCGAEIETAHNEHSSLVQIHLTNLCPGSIMILDEPAYFPQSGKAKINIALENLPDLAKLLQKYLPKKSRKRKRTR